MQSIYLAGGCFWCTEAIFKQLRGIEKITPGYIGEKLKIRLIILFVKVAQDMQRQ